MSTHSAIWENLLSYSPSLHKLVTAHQLNSASRGLHGSPIGILVAVIVKKHRHTEINETQWASRSRFAVQSNGEITSIFLDHNIYYGKKSMRGGHSRVTSPICVTVDWTMYMTRPHSFRINLSDTFGYPQFPNFECLIIRCQTTESHSPDVQENCW